jgi:hypothetical protein
MFGRALLLGTTLFALACGEDQVTGTNDRDLASGSIKATIDGASFSGTKNVRGLWEGNSQFRTLTLGASNADGTGIWITVAGIAFGTGTYTAVAGSPVFGSVSRGTGELWLSNVAPGGTGTITITDIDGGGAKGSFSFVAVPQPGSFATGSRTVTNGSFDIKFK